MTENKNMAENTGEERPKIEATDTEKLAKALEKPGTRRRGEEPKTGKPGGEEEGGPVAEKEEDKEIFSPEIVEMLTRHAPEGMPNLKDTANELLAVFTNQETTAQEIIQAAKRSNFPKAQLIAFLEAKGRDPAIIQEVANSDELSEQAETSDDPETETDRQDREDLDGAVDELEDQTRNASQILAQAQRGDVTEKEVKEFNEAAASTIDKIKEKFFYGDKSLLRSEDRMKRLVMKPLVTVLLVTMVAYLACLASLTRGSTARIGK